jgi:hypothetical protein
MPLLFVVHVVLFSPLTYSFFREGYSYQKVKNNVNIGRNVSYRTYVYRKKEETRDGRNEGRKDWRMEERSEGGSRRKKKRRKKSRSARKEIKSP